MQKKTLIMLVLTGIGGFSFLDAQIDRSFWKSDAEIDEFYGAAADERGAAHQRSSLVSIMDRLSKLEDYPESENFAYLGKNLWQLSRGNLYQLKERIEVYDKVQQAMLSIPGHARYFADAIRKGQKEVEYLPTNVGRGSYDFNRGLYFMTMSYLPSPETISVLGDFLADDKDQPPPLDPSKSYDYDIPPANSQYAADSIHKIGLRDPPWPAEKGFAYPEYLLAATRAWWEEVKSGKRTFSFKGQSVEYRFRPDATWDTIPIAKTPDDGPGSAAKTEKERPVRRSALAQADSREASRGVSWWWYGIGGLALLSACAWLWRRKG